MTDTITVDIESQLDSGVRVRTYLAFSEADLANNIERLECAQRNLAARREAREQEEARKKAAKQNKPTEPGWYWWWGTPCGLDMVEVTHSHVDGQLYQHRVGSSWLLGTVEGRWSDRLEPPEMS